MASPRSLDESLPLAPLNANSVLSRLECRLALEGAMEARLPRLIGKKPLLAGMPLGKRWGLGRGKASRGRTLGAVEPMDCLPRIATVDR